MIKKRKGVILNVASESGLEGSEGRSVYAATEAVMSLLRKFGQKKWVNQGLKNEGKACLI